MARPRFGPLAPVYVSVFLFTAAESGLHVLVPPYLSISLQQGPAAIGFLVAVFGVAALAARLPVGAFYTIARSRTLLLCGGGLSAVAFGLVPAVDGVAPFAVLMALDGLGFSIATTTQLALLVAIRPPSLPLASALGWYAGLQGLGHVAAGAVAGFAADRAGFGASFVLFAALAGVATVVMAWGAPPAANGRREEAAPRPVRSGRETVRAIRMLPAAVWSAVLVMFMLNFLLSSTVTFYPVLALAAGLSLTQIGILASCRAWSSSVVRLGSGPFFGRFRSEGLTLPLVVLGVASLVFLPNVAGSFALSVPLFVAAGVSRGLLRVTGAADALEGHGDERRQGLTSALIQGGLDLGRVAGPIIAGVVAHAVGIATMFRFVPIVLLALYLPLAVGARRSAARRTPSPST